MIRQKKEPVSAKRLTRIDYLNSIGISNIVNNEESIKETEPQIISKILHSFICGYDPKLKVLKGLEIKFDKAQAYKSKLHANKRSQ